MARREYFQNNQRSIPNSTQHFCIQRRSVELIQLKCSKQTQSIAFANLNRPGAQKEPLCQYSPNECFRFQRKIRALKCIPSVVPFLVSFRISPYSVKSRQFSIRILEHLIRPSIGDMEGSHSFHIVSPSPIVMSSASISFLSWLTNPKNKRFGIELGFHRDSSYPI